MTTNYIQAELRQFDISYEYLYKSSSEKSVKKLKASRSAVLKEFKAVKDLSSNFDNEAFVGNPESTLKKVFEELNK
jgi:hypothetical protein